MVLDELELLKIFLQPKKKGVFGSVGQSSRPTTV
jgi:hypothetical protein